MDRSKISLTWTHSNLLSTPCGLEDGSDPVEDCGPPLWFQVEPLVSSTHLTRKTSTLKGLVQDFEFLGLIGAGVEDWFVD
jgi:hypothetical protein